MANNQFISNVPAGNYSIGGYSGTVAITGTGTTTGNVDGNYTVVDTVATYIPYYGVTSTGWTATGTTTAYYTKTPTWPTPAFWEPSYIHTPYIPKPKPKSPAELDTEAWLDKYEVI